MISHIECFADADLNKKLYKSKSIVKIYTMPCVANHLWNGISTVTNNRKEWYQVIMKHYGWFYLLIHFGYRLIEILLRKENKNVMGGIFIFLCI